MPFLADVAIEQTRLKAAGTALLDRIGPALLITHSQGGPAGWLLADARPEKVKGIIAIEPAGPPFANRAIAGLQKPYGITDIPLTYDPPPDAGDAPLPTETLTSPDGQQWKLQAQPARRLVKVSKVPVVLVTAEASYHAAYDEFTVEFLRQAGIKVEWLRLVDHGIKGNGHMMFMELNNLEIARLIETRIAQLT